MKIGIINYGVGNIASIQNMLKKSGNNSEIFSEPETIDKYDKLILPGVGSFDFAMNKLINNSWIMPLNYFALEIKKPILGICLGMQLMCNRSEEGQVTGLSWINAEVKKFKTDDNFNFKVPHMGWNSVKFENINSKFFESLNGLNKFYFVHSYFIECYEKKDISSITNYNGIEFVSSFNKENIYGVQFHPEKSHKYGLKLLENFAKI
jgi:glutamine amidotransferase